MKVVKFGGSSLADASQFRRVRDIILADKERLAVVVSAPGKRSKTDIKITDLLLTLEAHLRYSVPYENIWSDIRDRYAEIALSLDLKLDIKRVLDSIEGAFRPTLDGSYLVSRGEYLCARLMADYLGFDFVDATDTIRFGYDGVLDEADSSARMRRAWETAQKSGRGIVVPGFYGAYPNGDIKLFSRGGSDITGAYVARFLGAELYENWTDVSGICAADPRLAKSPKSIPQITYTELREMSYMGANVLHEDSVMPVQDAGIPIHILNTNRPSDTGTDITLTCPTSPVAAPITGIAGKRGFMSFIVHKKRMSGEIGFLRKVLSVFEKYAVNIEHTPTGMDLLSIVVSEEQAARYAHSIIAELELTLGCEVKLERGIALISVVGRNMAGRAGVCAVVFGIFGEHGINIKIIAQSPDELNIIIGIEERDYARAIECLYEGLLEKGMI